MNVIVMSVACCVRLRPRKTRARTIRGHSIVSQEPRFRRYNNPNKKALQQDFSKCFGEVKEDVFEGVSFL